MKIYLAASYSRREELCGYRDELRLRGHQITSRWLNGSHSLSELSPGATEEYREAKLADFAQEDWDDIIECDLLVSFLGLPSMAPNTGGRHVELGIALGRMKKCVIIGMKENVFHRFSRVKHFDSFDAFLEDQARETSSQVAIRAMKK